jgi:hypothetical protein
MDFITGTDGKDYSIGLGKPATFVADRDEPGQVRRKFLDAGEFAAHRTQYPNRPRNVEQDSVPGTASSIAHRATHRFA